MRKILFWVLLLALVGSFDVQAVGLEALPESLQEATPQEAETLLQDFSFSGAEDFFDGSLQLFEIGKDIARQAVKENVKNVVLILVVVMLCSLLEGVGAESGSELGQNAVTLAGTLAITALAAGDVTGMIGMGVEKIQELSQFSKALLPTLAAATAASGSVGAASVQQVLTVFFADVLLTVTENILAPLVYLYIGVVAAEAVIRKGRLEGIATGIKKIITTAMTVALMLFTGYLAISGAVSGVADSLSVKLTKMAVSSAVPVVGGIISEATATVMASAGLLRSTIGVFGILAVLALCIAPFLQIAVQYALYKLSGFVAAMFGCEPLVKLIDRIGGAFGLVLGMIGSAVLLVMVSVLFSIMTVTP